jgi:ABC-type Fe3+/spermidine/putrescine transport system ATPase subunit
MTTLQLDGLIKRYERVAVVDGATLEVRHSELTVILGPAGAGKTTIARLIAGLETLDDGGIFVDGRIINTQPPQSRRVGMLFQDDALWPLLTAAENVEHGLWSAGLGRRERRRKAIDSLARLASDGLASRRPIELSPLQHRRVSLARAIVGEPDILLLDDPFGPLDERAAMDFRDDLRRIHDESQSVTLAFTSEPRDALRLGDRLAVLDLGRIVQIGSPRDVYERPIDVFVARFLGPTNLVQGQVEGLDGRGGATVRTPLGRLAGQIAGNGTSGLAVGTPVTLSIRPEALAFGPSALPDSNRITATLDRQSFLGTTTQLVFRGPGDWPLTATALQVHGRDLREGEATTLWVAPAQVIVMLGRYAGVG